MAGRKATEGWAKRKTKRPWQESGETVAAAMEHAGREESGGWESFQRLCGKANQQA